MTNEQLKQQNKALKIDLEFTKERLNCANRRLEHYKQYLIIAVNLLNHKQYKKYVNQFFQIKNKQITETNTEMEKMVERLFNLK